MRPFTALGAIIFALIALLHSLRLFLGWKVSVDGIDIPMWVSVLGMLIAGGLALMLWREARR
jgi:hypothetical protein